MAAGGLRERKKAETRLKIEEVALELFEARSFESVTVEDIAEVVGISPRTFFHYFHTKEDVVLSDYSERLDRIVDALEARPADEPAWRALQNAFMEVASDYVRAEAEIARRFRIIASAESVFARNLQLQAGWETMLADALDKRIEGSDGLSPALLAGAALATMRASMRAWLASGGSTPLPDLVEECFSLLSTGLGGDR